MKLPTPFLIMLTLGAAAAEVVIPLEVKNDDSSASDSATTVKTTKPKPSPRSPGVRGSANNAEGSKPKPNANLPSVDNMNARFFGGNGPLAGMFPPADGNDGSSMVNNDYDTHIVGGSPVERPSDYPYYSYLPVGCGASLIAPNVVLSAAHCNDNFGGRIWVGTYNLQTDIGREVAIERKVVHPNYNDDTIRWDFMLIFLKEDITDIPLVPINSNDNIPADGDMLTVIGTGTTFEGGSQSNRLREVDVPTVGHTKCNNWYDGGIHQASMLCAGYPEGEKDSCNGDSGGPIINQAGVQVGVVSWGYGCARPNAPGVYARVSGAYDWIVSEACPGPGPFCDGAPAPSPTPPSPTPPTGTCENDSSWTFTTSTGATKKCGWVANRPDRRCNKKGDDGRLASEACQVACDTCGDSGSGGSGGGSGGSDCISLNMRLRTDAYAYENNYYLFQDGEDVWWDRGGGLDSNVVYTESESCLDPSSCWAFYISDSYGDGIEGEGVTLTIDGRQVYSSGNFGDEYYREFGNCGGGGGTGPSPTLPPTPAPTPNPTPPPTTQAPTACPALRFELTTDGVPKDTLYFLYQDGTDVWRDSGFGLSANTRYVEQESCLEPSSCWTVKVLDISGNGIRGDGITLTVGGREVFSGGNIGSEYEYQVGAC